MLPLIILAAILVFLLFIIETSEIIIDFIGIVAEFLSQKMWGIYLKFSYPLFKNFKQCFLKRIIK
ncbi:hypothetical protein D1632_09735 [Chryseobacterium nematophagum]|uniref:Uncharacterized protein n=1 Tax=Chryseobacterium nematophagum TaxID=2305228 RepID=A0A3M7LBG3_9FLAO|nr:hypothetical protein D1632_09735 [Chryseobacterium nematophagum]